MGVSLRPHAGRCRRYCWFMPVAQIPSSDLVNLLRIKAGEDVDQDVVDVLLLEIMAWLQAGPARCRTDLSEWDDLPGEAQGVLLGVLARQATGGGSNVVQERVGDYSVKYSDPALFEGKLPSYLFESEEVALARIFGCGGNLTSVRTGGVTLISDDRLEADLTQQDHRERQKIVGF